MQSIIDGIVQAFWLLVHGDPRVLQIALLSILVSGAATLISLIIGIPVGSWLGMNRFPGRRFLISIVNTGMGLPPVSVGLVVAIFLWRSGPLGFLGMMYTPYAMILAQTIIAFPIVVGFTMAAVQQLDPKLGQQILSLGASRVQLVWLLLKEARLPLLAAIMAGFGAVISEVGASMMVGANIQGSTRILTTAIVGIVSTGDYAFGIALAVILLLLVYAVNLVLTIIQQRSKAR
jgi:tungstate transport system permease protein